MNQIKITAKDQLHFLERNYTQTSSIFVFWFWKENDTSQVWTCDQSLAVQMNSNTNHRAIGSLFAVDFLQYPPE